jgi:hypothetical protein
MLCFHGFFYPLQWGNEVVGFLISRQLSLTPARRRCTILGIELEGISTRGVLCALRRQGTSVVTEHWDCPVPIIRGSSNKSRLAYLSFLP